MKRMFIGGRWLGARDERTLEVVDPADGLAVEAIFRARSRGRARHGPGLRSGDEPRAAAVRAALHRSGPRQRCAGDRRRQPRGEPADGGVELPFGGTRRSGHGREKGLLALEEVGTTKTLVHYHG